MQGDINPEQYEAVLKYMETSGEEDFQTARLLLQQNGYDVNAAINSRFSNNNFNNNHQNQNEYHEDVQNNDNDDQIVRKMIQHIQKQNQNWNIFYATFGFVKNLTVGILKFASQLILPQFLLKKLVRSQFYNLYHQNFRFNLQDQRISKILQKTKQLSYKSCFLVISQKRTHECVVGLMNRMQISNKIHQNFYFVGYVEGNKDLDIIQRPQNPPQIVLCRYNVFKQVIIIERIVGQANIAAITVQKLNRLCQQSRNLHKKDRNALIKYRNFIRRNYYGHMYLQEEQEQEVNFVARQQTSQQIREQNQLYKKIEEESLKQLKLEQQKRMKMQQEKSKIEEIIEQRKVRKLSIPDQPLDGEIFRLIFRCPDGSTKVRNFKSDQKIQLIYNWVQTNNEIQLQDNQKRQFQILYSYPPKPLTDMKDQLMKDVFQSDQQKLLIRQL